MQKYNIEKWKVFLCFLPFKKYSRNVKKMPLVKKSSGTNSMEGKNATSKCSCAVLTLETNGPFSLEILDSFWRMNHGYGFSVRPGSADGLRCVPITTLKVEELETRTEQIF